MAIQPVINNEKPNQRNNKQEIASIMNNINENDENENILKKVMKYEKKENL